MKTALLLTLSLALALSVMAEPPKEWIDPQTGHRVIRLSRDAGSTSFYFHQNTYTTEGDKLLISTPAGLATVSLTNQWALDVVVPRESFALGGSSGVEI